MRRWLRRLLLAVVVVLAGLLPPCAFVAVAVYQTRQQMNAQLERYAANTLDRADGIFAAAEATLGNMERSLAPNCGDATLAAMRRIVFESIYFQEAGLIADGAVQCTSMRTYKPPVPIQDPDHGQLPLHGMHISGPARILEGATALILSGRVDARSGFDLLLNPAHISEPFQKYSTEDEVSVAVLRQDGTVLTRFGFKPGEDIATLPGQRIVHVSSRYPVRVVAVGDPAWLVRTGEQNALIFGAMGLITSALLMLLVLYYGRRRLSAGGGIADALADEQFQVYYQPVFEPKSGACVGAEALLRWHHPQLGVLLPSTFIATAEANGLIARLTTWLMRRIVHDMAVLLKSNPDFHIALNLSPKHFADPRLLADLKQVFGDRVNPGQIILEVTESQLILDEDSHAMETLRNIRIMGMQIAIDDFGSGYSSLKYLSRFPFDYLKIDKTFVDAIGTEAFTAGLVDTIVQMAGQLKLKTIAEGVENQRQLEHLKSLGVDMVQGWLFSKALPSREFYNLFADNRMRQHRQRTDHG